MWALTDRDGCTGTMNGGNKPRPATHTQTPASPQMTQHMENSKKSLHQFPPAIISSSFPATQQLCEKQAQSCEREQIIWIAIFVTMATMLSILRGHAESYSNSYRMPLSWKHQTLNNKWISEPYWHVVSRIEDGEAMPEYWLLKKT